KSKGTRYMDFSRNGLAQDTTLQESQGSYGLWGASIGYKWQNLSARVGVSNILNKRLYVDGKAQSYNEPGRTYYTTLKYSF
ncbi:MAG: TonB-dependent receptor, partial [Staphylococcus simulans]|nr:TonB-dependent receptor [Staphylococcus simulans]